MKVKKRLLEELKKAETNQFERMENIINKILTSIKEKDIKSDKELLRRMNNEVISLGDKIVKTMEKPDITKMESLMFEQNILNEYVSEFKYGKHRPIYYEREVEGFINTKLDDDGDSLVFKIKKQK